MPSVPAFPAQRQTAARMAAWRTAQSFDWYDSAQILTGATTTFQEVITFSGRPDSIILETTGSDVDVRLRNRGQAAGSTIRIPAAGMHILDVTAEIVEARDPAGAGGQRVSAIGRFVTRDIDVRNNFPGPSRARSFRPDEELATQIKTPE